MKKEELRNKYIRQSEEYNESAAKEEKIIVLLSVLRLVCFLGGSLIIIFLAVSHHAGLSMLSAILFIILFLFLLKTFAQHSDRKETATNLSAVNRNEAAALSGDLSGFRTGHQFIDNSHDFSFDIDLFGKESLFNYLNRTVTGYGEEILAGWLSNPYPLAPEIGKRQEIIKELASKMKWRHEFMATGMKVPIDSSHATELSEWLHSSIKMGPVKKLLIFLLPAVTLICLILVVTGVLHYSVFIIIILFNLGYVASGMKMTNDVHRLVSGKYEWLSTLNRLLAVFGDESFGSVHLVAMQKEISGTNVSAAASVSKLGKIIKGFDTRLNILAGFTLNALLLWDYHCIRKLEKWKDENREKFAGWLKIIAEADAFSSLGNYSYNNPDFAWPGISAEGIILEAKKTGHPLIAEENRVCNDFLIDSKGRICIITGANMAGKSTFLRTVAVNYIIAMSGAPVCSSKFILTPVKLFTSMRTTDSLAGNESYFYAELKRLRSLKAKIMDDESVFFILDEILKGTNSADKALGSQLFLNKLILHGATGLIATHDISLAGLEKDHPENVFNMCFEVEIDGSEISFDYKLQKGITKKMNAAILMRQMGILD